MGDPHPLKPPTEARGLGPAPVGLSGAGSEQASPSGQEVLDVAEEVGFGRSGKGYAEVCVL